MSVNMRIRSKHTKSMSMRQKDRVWVSERERKSVNMSIMALMMPV